MWQKENCCSWVNNGLEMVRMVAARLRIKRGDGEMGHKGEKVKETTYFPLALRL